MTKEAKSGNSTFWPYWAHEYSSHMVSFVLSQDVTGLCTVGDTRLLPLVLQACDDYIALSKSEQEALIASAEEYEPLFT